MNIKRVLPYIRRSGASVMRLPAEDLLVPVRGRRGRVGDQQVNVVVRERRRLRIVPFRPVPHADEQRLVPPR